MPNEPVDDSEELFRCVKAEYVRIVDGNAHCTERGFLDRQRKVSVDRALICGNNPDYSRRHTSDYVVQVVSEEVRGIRTVVRRSATASVEHVYVIDVVADSTDENPAHALICGDEDLNGSAFAHLREELADLAQFVAFPREE